MRPRHAAHELLQNTSLGARDSDVKIREVILDMIRFMSPPAP